MLRNARCVADSHVLLFMPIHLSPEGLSVLGICTVKSLLPRYGRSRAWCEFVISVIIGITYLFNNALFRCIPWKKKISPRYWTLSRNPNALTGAGASRSLRTSCARPRGWVLTPSWNALRPDQMIVCSPFHSEVVISADAQPDWRLPNFSEND
jgi:hypothetical protein